MADLRPYRDVIARLFYTPEFKRYIQMMEQEPNDNSRVSAIEEWRKLTIDRLRGTLAPLGQKGRLKDYADNLAWEGLKKEPPKVKP